MLLQEWRRTSRDQATQVSSPLLRPARLAKCSLSVMMTMSARSTETAIRVFSIAVPSFCGQSISCNRPASSATASQPKSVSVAADGTVFVAEINGVEAIRDNQKVFELKTSYSPSAVAAGKSINIVAIGEVGVIVQYWAALRIDGFVTQDKKVRLHEWDGKALKEIASLTGNRGVVSSMAFSPDDSLLSAGDVGIFLLLTEVCR